MFTAKTIYYEQIGIYYSKNYYNCYYIYNKIYKYFRVY